MASPSLLPGQGSGQPPPSTAPPGPRTDSPSSGPRLPSEPRSASANADVTASQTPGQSPSMSQPVRTQDRAPAPSQNGTQPQKSNAQIKVVVGTDEYAELASLIANSKPEVVRQVVRDQWQRCVVGSDFHIGFVLNTALHHASPRLLTQAVQDFGAKLASATKHEWVQHLDTADVDEISNALLQRASDRFFDRALARRFETISGRALVNALARAERLGYNLHDIVEEKDSNRPEQVIPSMYPSTPASYPPQYPPQAYTPQYAQQPTQAPYQPPPPPAQVAPSFPITRPSPAQLAEVEHLGIKFCDHCGRPCSGTLAAENHLRKHACSNHVTKLERLGSDTCLHCGVAFTSNGGLQYHNKSAVCGAYTNAVSAKMTQLLTERAKIPSVKGAQARPPMPAPQPPTIAQHYAQADVRSSPTRQDPADAYAALTPQQQASFDAEMKAAEDMYGRQMREAMALPPAEAESELNKIKNRLNSRQSNLRKKYGIKLRDRRTKAQIDADNARIAANSPVPVSSQGMKRPLSSQADSPRKRVPLSQMSGLVGAAASVEMTDPTVNITSTQPGAPGTPAQAAPMASMHISGTQTDPMAIDSDHSATASSSGQSSPSREEAAAAEPSEPTLAGDS